MGRGIKACICGDERERRKERKGRGCDVVFSSFVCLFVGERVESQREHGARQMDFLYYIQKRSRTFIA